MLGDQEERAIQLQAFVPRDIMFRGVVDKRGWSLKSYSVEAGDRPFDVPGFDMGVDLALAALPAPAPDIGRPGLGFLISHQGLGVDYLILAWWSNENELPIRTWVRSSGERWRPAVEGESVCVWDLEVVWEERQAWIGTMMSGRARPDRYLTTVSDRFKPAGGASKPVPLEAEDRCRG